MYATNQNSGGYGRENLSPIAKNNQYSNVYILPTNSAQAAPLPPIKPQNSTFSNNKKIFFISMIVIAFLAIILVAFMLAYFLTQNSTTNVAKTATTFTTSGTSITPFRDNLTLTPISNCSAGQVGAYCEIECGIINTTPDLLRIVGGTTAIAYSWPSIAIIIFSYKATVLVGGSYQTISESTLCGGSLLDLTTVLTAAHCIVTQISYTYNGKTYNYKVVPNQYYPTIGSMYTVYLGIYDRSNLNSPGSQIIVAKTAVRNPAYDPTNILNDIAIIKLSSQAVLSNIVQVACLPVNTSSLYPAPTSKSYAVGWGTLSSGGSLPKKLNEVTLNIYSNSVCDNVGTGQSKDYDKEICAGDLSGVKDTCQGDSGGPLYIQDTIGVKTKLVNVGLTSYGIGCATPGLASIYTRVNYYLDWIQSYMD